MTTWLDRVLRKVDFINDNFGDRNARAWIILVRSNRGSVWSTLEHDLNVQEISPDNADDVYDWLDSQLNVFLREKAGF